MGTNHVRFEIGPWTGFVILVLGAILGFIALEAKGDEPARPETTTEERILDRELYGIQFGVGDRRRELRRSRRSTPGYEAARDYERTVERRSRARGDRR